MQALNEFLSLTKQLETKSEYSPCVIAVVGSFNAGKSTLINKLLQQNISPVETLPTTSIQIIIKYGQDFTARAKNTKKTICFPVPEKMLSFLKNNTVYNYNNIEIALPHPLLKKCTLIDTPGIDSTSNNNIESVLNTAINANKIIYLFHQRGIDKTNRQFLSKLNNKRKLKQKDISFWINCNMGKVDGTSLDNTKEALQNILGWQPETYLINTLQKDSTNILSKFLEISISRDRVKEISSCYKNIDYKLPSRLKKNLQVKSDALFLDSFWQVKKDAEKILLARNILNDLPPVESKMNKMLANSQGKYLFAGNDAQGPGHYRYKSPGIPEIKNSMSRLASKMMHDRQLKKIISPGEIGKWIGQLNREEFKITAVGGFSSGKSTFFNAIMGENILPVENRPTTACITYLSYGPERKAVINLHSRISLNLFKHVNTQAEICLQEIQAVEEWLSTNLLEQISMDAGKGMQKTSKNELLKEINRVKKIFSAGLRTGKLDNRQAGKIFQPVPAWKIKTAAPIQKVTLAFKEKNPFELNLDNQEIKNKFMYFTTSREAFRIKDIHITHPADFLKLATFIDTPGLDSVFDQHGALVTDFLQKSDSYLFFLNGKHVLNHNDSSFLLETFNTRLQDFLSTRDDVTREINKFYFIINFADVLTPRERQKVKIYVQKVLSNNFKHNNVHASSLQVILLSPLHVLQGKDKKEFNKFLNQVRCSIWNYRGKDYLLNHLRKLKNMVKIPVQDETGPSTNPPYKFTAADDLISKTLIIKNEINDCFNKAAAQINHFNKAEQFKNYNRGYPAEIDTDTLVKDHFTWINSLNNRLKQLFIDTNNQIYKKCADWLSTINISTNPNCIPPPLPEITASPAITKMEEILSENKNFYGKIKIKDTRLKFLEILDEEKNNLVKAVDMWNLETVKYQKNLLTNYTAAIKNNFYPTFSSEVLRQDEKEALNRYLSELNSIENMLIN
ncbi:MAG: dynamin family protein [Clostridiales bacterium]|nr:dynamin family protein [Clostridiales bacterium]MCF8022973.1 dynamin family protein [Clostridiales bacterium]